MVNKIDGLEITFNEKSIVCQITDFSNALKEIIRQHLSNICHGKNLASKGLIIHSYKNTLKEFKNRYELKTEKIKKGMIGELLSHVLIHEFFHSFDVVSPFFNMEEKSQRKGFDLLLVSKSDDDLWITEVKSGELGSNTNSTAAVSSFLHSAKRDLKRRLNESEETFWLNAINTANNAISDCTDYKNAILSILDYEGDMAIKNKADSKDNNVILISVLFHDDSDLFDKEISDSVSLSIENEGIFKKVITFAIQKDMYQKIEAFIFQEEIDG